MMSVYRCLPTAPIFLQKSHWMLFPTHQAPAASTVQIVESSWDGHNNDDRSLYCWSIWSKWKLGHGRESTNTEEWVGFSEEPKLQLTCNTSWEDVRRAFPVNTLALSKIYRLGVSFEIAVSCWGDAGRVGRYEPIADRATSATRNPTFPQPPGRKFDPPKKPESPRATRRMVPRLMIQCSY